MYVTLHWTREFVFDFGSIGADNGASSLLLFVFEVPFFQGTAEQGKPGETPARSRHCEAFVEMLSQNSCLVTLIAEDRCFASKHQADLSFLNKFRTPCFSGR